MVQVLNIFFGCSKEGHVEMMCTMLVFNGMVYMVD